MNDDIFPVTPRITDPDLRPSQYGADRQYGGHSPSHNDGSLIDFEQGANGKPMNDVNPKGRDGAKESSGGFNVLGFNLTYKHIIIIVLVVIALLIVIYLVVSWMRKSSSEGLGTCAPPQAQGMPAQGMPQRQPQRAPGGVGANQRVHPDAGKSSSELAALLQQSQNKLNELGGEPIAHSADNTVAEDAAAETPDNPQQEVMAPTSTSTHMEVPQEQIDNILSTGEDE